MIDRNLLERMEIAAALGPGEPERVDVERDVEASGAAEVVATWEMLLEESEALLRTLGDVQVPVGLEARLQSLPDRSARPRPFVWRSLAAAALLLVAGGLGAVLWPPPTASAIENVAREAVASYLHDNHTTYAGMPSDTLGEKLGDELTFCVDFPPFGDEFELLGGRRSTLGTVPVAFTAWRGPEGVYALYQFPAASKGLALAEADRPVVPVSDVPCFDCACNTAATAATSPCKGCACTVVVWQKGDQGFVLVSDRPDVVDLVPRP